jgi:hypothetical protein
MVMTARNHRPRNVGGGFMRARVLCVRAARDMLARVDASPGRCHTRVQGCPAGRQSEDADRGQPGVI